jgi:hypothetical protein
MAQIPSSSDADGASFGARGPWLPDQEPPCFCECEGCGGAGFDSQDWRRGQFLERTEAETEALDMRGRVGPPRGSSSALDEDRGQYSLFAIRHVLDQVLDAVRHPGPVRQSRQDTVEKPEQTVKRGRGRPRASNVERDRRISEAMASGRYLTRADLGRVCGISESDVTRALDRHRKRAA